MVLLVLVNVDYYFLWVDVGSRGSSSVHKYFKWSKLREKTEDGECM